MNTAILTDTSLSSIQTMISHSIKIREISMNSNALAYRSVSDLPSSEHGQVSLENAKLLSTIKATLASLDKLTLISDFSKAVDAEVTECLIKGDRFERLTRAEILDELLSAAK